MYQKKQNTVGENILMLYHTCVQVVHSVLHYIISTVMEGVCIQLIKASHREFQRLKVSFIVFFLHHTL